MEVKGQDTLAYGVWTLAHLEVKGHNIGDASHWRMRRPPGPPQFPPRGGTTRKSQHNPSQCFRKHEREKIRAYGQRVREVEHATFVPIVMSATGGLSKQATNFYKRLASLLADKQDQPYSTTLHWLRCSLSFSLFRSAIQCIRGARSSRDHAMKMSPVDLVIAEASLQQN